MAKRLSEKGKEEILKDFTGGFTLEKLSDKYNFSKLTISRNLKKVLGDKKYKELLNKNKSARKNINNLDDTKNNVLQEKLSGTNQINNKESHFYENKKFSCNEQSQESEFYEIAPINFDIDEVKRKDLSSIPIKNIKLPDIVYMIVDKSIELEIKLLNEYQDWQFLPPEDLNRKTIQIFYDLKVAKRNCNKNQKVLKVPNSKVFEIVSPILISRGISRIITEEHLISL